MRVISSRCNYHKGATLRGMHLRREKEDKKLKSQDSDIAASFYGLNIEGQEALETSYGIIQKIIGVDIPDSLADKQCFLEGQVVQTIPCARRPKHPRCAIDKVYRHVISF